MDWVRLACLAFLFCAHGADAQTSLRWQDLRFDADAFASDTEDRYTEKIVTLAAAGQLDHDHTLLRRIRTITPALINAAAAYKVGVRDWRWEFHTTSDPGIEAFSMAGGKILVGSRFVRKLGLNDGELAMLLAHEMAHAVAEHQRETLSEAQLLSGRALPLEVVAEQLESDMGLQLRLAGLSRIQESEADQLGMELVHAAGWPPEAMLRFYRKLAIHEQGRALFDACPDARTRLSMARGMARLFASGR